MILLLACTSSNVPSVGGTTQTDDSGATTEGDAAALSALAFPSDVSCGGSDAASVTMVNSGTTTWTREGGYKLGAFGDEDPFYELDTRVWLPEGAAVVPGDAWTFEIPLEAPSAAGIYTSDWQMVQEAVHWFGDVGTASVAVSCAGPRTGPVRLVDGVLTDDDGAFNARGATLMWAAWGYRHDRERLERNLATLQAGGFDYIRALGVVGDPNAEDGWDGREIDATWPDYAEVIAGLTDLAYGSYGLRVEWTLIGDGQVAVPQEADRYALVDTFLAMSEGREGEILHFEIANESWQNGFDGDDGLAQLRALTAYMHDRTDILVAASAPAGVECEDFDAVYAGDIADIATMHFDRDTSQVEGSWRPVRQPWGLADCTEMVGSNNEPIGPGSSVASEESPIRLVSAAIASYVSQVPFYVFHSRAGVRGDSDISAMSGWDAFSHVRDLVPGDVAGWDRKNGHWADAPFQPFAEDGGGNLHADQMWTDLSDPAAGAVRVYSAVDGTTFFSFPFGILDHLLLAARRDLDYTMWDPLTGEEVGSGTLGTGETLTIEGYESVVIRGNYR